jgi:Tfp pilus assembly major pilin PilA
MHTSQRTQRGASAIGLIIILTIIGAGTYIGLQYIPQYIEAGTVDSILSNIEQTHEETPVSSANSIRNMIERQLDINQMDDLRDSFKVTQDEEIYIITVSYERELNLIYEKKPMKYEKTVTLR